MNATVFAAYKHKPSVMNRHYSLSMWTSLTDGPTNSVALALLVLLVILVLLFYQSWPLLCQQSSDCVQVDTLKAP